MVESAVHFHERLYFPSSTTAGDRAFVGPAAENGPLKPAAATYLPHRDIESQAISAPNQIDDPSEARVDSHDAEKNPFERHSLSSHGLSYNHSRVTCGDDEVDDGPQEHAIWILIYLSILSPLVTLPIALYTLLIGTLLLLLFPLCLSLKQLPICARFRHILSPLLVFQLGLVYSHYDIGDPVHSGTSGILVLVLVSILSPLYAMAISVATWVAGVFWFYTAILGNPDGRENRDDGREAVLAVRGWWERWLVQALEPEDHSTLQDSGSEVADESS